MKWVNSLDAFAAQLREHIVTALEDREIFASPCDDSGDALEPTFNKLALNLFELQLTHNQAYAVLCANRGITANKVEHWSQMPAAPAAAFKELEFSSIQPASRTTVFFSSGTTGQQPSRHFHNQNSLAVYEESLLRWFETHFPGSGPQQTAVSLTPDPARAPHSSLVHMLDTLRRRLEIKDFQFTGRVSPDGAWLVDCAATFETLRIVMETGSPMLVLGTAFSFVHLLDYLSELNLKLRLPLGSRILETGGYKGRSRALSKLELHSLITERLGVAPSQIVCEYGMSELSSQAYDHAALLHISRQSAPALPARCFQFPPWARVRIISPETGREVSNGETGLIQVFDLANVYSVMAVQTQDLGVRRSAGFELVGRATLAEPRGCSLMASTC